MMIYRTMTAEEQSDTELVSRSLAGDRDAFSRIVSRYQTLICSLAYSRIGNLVQSEDIAQETFITAWNHLRLLREPAKLRAWLCGIVRNRIHKNLRREGREPAHNAESLDTVHDSPANEALPSEHAVSREEEAILWRSLQNIPESYREPLILFYREHQSIEAVADELELSEDAVKQRLSRGRKLLREEVQAFVEKTLRRTAPSRAFSGTVLAALPAGPATTAGVGAVGKGAAAAKSGFVGAWLAPIIGILGGITAHWLIARAAPNARERRLKKFGFIGLWIFVLAWCIPGQLGMLALSRHLGWSDPMFFRVMAGFWWCYAVVLATFSIAMFRRISVIRQEGEESNGILHITDKRLKANSRFAAIAGVHLACFSWLIGLALQAHDQASAGVITGVMLALAFRNFVGLRGKTGPAAAFAVAQHQAMIWGTILVILNVRLEAWLASLHGIDLAEMHLLLPVWIIPLLTLTVVAWIGLLVRITKPKRWTAGALPARTLHGASPRIHPLMNVPVPWVFVLTFFAGVGLQYVVPLAIHSVVILRINRIAGMVLTVSGVLLAFSSLAIFRAARTTTVPFQTASRLVTWGPYRFTRNPMYVSLILIYLGVAGIQAQICPVFLLPLVVIYLHTVVIPFEEARLREAFGDTYKQFCARVRRWI